MQTERLAYTANKVAEMLSISLVQVRRYTATGVLPCHRMGRSVRYTLDDIQAFLDATGEAA